MKGCQAHIQTFNLFLIGLVSLGFSGLSLKAVYVALHFGDNVVDAHQILLSSLDFPKGLVFSTLIPGRACRLFDKETSLLWPGVNQGGDPCLLNDCIGSGAHATSHQQVLDILKSAWLLIDEVNALTRPEEAAGYHNFRKLSILFRRVAIIIDEC